MPELPGQIVRFLGRRGLDAVRQGRFRRSLAAVTALGALTADAEIWLEHDPASFGYSL